MLLYGKTVKQWIFSETVVVYDIKVGGCSQLNKDMTLYEYQRSRSFTDIGPYRSHSYFVNFFSSISTWPIEAKLYVESPWDEGTKGCPNCLGHMTKMVTMPIYGKILSNLLWNLKANDLFYGQIRFGPVCFCTGKS